jgi:hypothetical protein
VASIVAEAANARNGWKVILARCAPTTTPRSIAQLARDLIAARDLGDHSGRASRCGHADHDLVVHGPPRAKTG